MRSIRRMKYKQIGLFGRNMKYSLPLVYGRYFCASRLYSRKAHFVVVVRINKNHLLVLFSRI